MRNLYRLLITLIVCIWCFFSYIKIRVIYSNPDRNITIRDIDHEKKLKRFDIIGIVIGFMILTIGISILGSDISRDIGNIKKDCPNDDDITYEYNGNRAISITNSFNVLHIIYWILILIVFIFIFISRYLLKGPNKQIWIDRVNSKCCC